MSNGERFGIHGVLTRILREVARSSRPLDGSAFWVVIAAENTEKCGLPGTISPYQTDLVPGLDLEGGPINDGLSPDLDYEVSDAKHRSSQAPLRGSPDIGVFVSRV